MKPVVPGAWFGPVPVTGLIPAMLMHLDATEAPTLDAFASYSILGGFVE